VLSYPVSIAECHPPMHRRRGKRGGCFLRVQISREGRAALQALCECLGVTVKLFLGWAVQQRIVDTAASFDIDSWKAGWLSKGQRARLRRMYRDVSTNTTCFRPQNN